MARCALRGVVIAVLAVVAGCGSAVEIVHHSVSAECAAFLDDLPATMNAQERRDVRPSDVSAAAYGDPPLIVLCDVDVPPEFGIDSACVTANGIDWYAPDEQYLDQELTVTLTTVYRSPGVRVEIPADYRPEGVAAALAQLAPAVQEHTTSSDRCGSPKIESPR